MVAAAADYFYANRIAGALSSLFLNTFPFLRTGNVRASLERCGELAHRLAVFGKWSMLDVIVVGILVVVVKIEGMVSVKVHAGVYFFAASVILTMITTAWIGKMLATRGT